MMKSLFSILLLLPLLTFAQTKEELTGRPEEQVKKAEASKERDPDLLVNKQRKIQVLENQEKLRILYYKPIYFAYGDPLTKLQYSFRVPLLEDSPFNFAYTQMIFWELQKDSKPFLDATYNPEFFYRMNFGKNVIRSVDFGIWEHNSNGKGPGDSRSYDQSYVRGNWAFESKSWVIQLSAKVKYLYNNDEENRDIYDYISPIEGEIKFIQLFDSIFDQLEAVINVNPGGKWGTEWDKGGYQLSFNFHLGGLKVVPAFYIQYYHGYAETLVNYNESVDEVRAGFMF